MFLQRLPVLPNGKLDRGALPEPEWGKRNEEQRFVPPRTPLEKALAQIWSDVLEVAKVGMEDNFFDLGGHSLRATQVVSRVRSVFGVDVPLRAIFERPTVGDLAALISEILGTDVTAVAHG